MRKFKLVGQLKIVLLLVLITISSFSYIPNIYLNDSLYSMLHLVLLASMVGLTILTNNFFKLLNNKFLNRIVLYLVLFSFFILPLYALGYRVTFQDIIQIAIVCFSVWIGYELYLKERGITILLFIYACCASILGVSSLFTYLGSMSMAGNMYAIIGKNQIGAIVSIAAFVMFYTSQTSSIKKYRFIALLLFIFLIIILTVVRCRTALLAFLLVAIFSFVKINPTRKLALYSVFGFLLFLIFSQQLFEIFQEAFLGDRGFSDMDDLSSNRLERNVQGLSYFANNPFIGEMKEYSGIAIIHNYLLNRFVLYGIWAFPLAMCYFIFLLKIFKKTFIPRSFSFYDVGFFALIIPFICSLLEPDAPFGPGTVQSFTYILFGYSLKNTYNKP